MNIYSMIYMAWFFLAIGVLIGQSSISIGPLEWILILGLLICPFGMGWMAGATQAREEDA